MTNSQKTVSLLSVVNSSLGPVNVNFDAETAAESLDCESFSRILYKLGLRWSQTYQSSTQVSTSESSAFIKRLLWEFGGRFSANLVLGNAAYGLIPNIRLLHHLAVNVASAAGQNLKLGAEGLENGKRSIDIAAQTGSYAYILHTSSSDDLIHYCKERTVRFMIYTLLRVAETKAAAAEELVRIRGMGYFERRGVAREDVAQRLGEFSIFGSTHEIITQIYSFIERGASKVVLCPVFANQKDLVSQLKQLSNCLESLRGFFSDAL